MRPRPSYERERIIWEADCLSPTQKLVLLAFNGYADGNGANCYPSYQTISSRTGYNRRTIIRVTSELAARNILEVAARKTTEGRDTSNLYRINFDVLAFKGVSRSPEGRNSDRRSIKSDPGTLMDGVPGSPDHIQLRSDPESKKSESEDLGEHTPGNFQSLSTEKNLKLKTEKNLKTEKTENAQKPKKTNSSLVEAKNSKLQGEKLLNPGGGAVFCQAGPFLARIAEEKWRTAYNTSKAVQWLPWGTGCLSGAILDGVANFLSVAKDEDDAIDLLRKSVAWAAKNEGWLASKRFRPSQLLDPNSKNFLGQFREISAQTETQSKPAAVSWEERIRNAINPLAAWEAMA